MKNAVLISIKPEWVCKILNGEKTIEIRKTTPKCDLPIDVYIYCTKAKPNLYRHIRQEFFHRKTTLKAGLWNGKVVAKFTLRNVEEIKPFSFMKILVDGLTEKQKEIADKSCDGWLDISKYANCKSIYLWHISNLIIFDQPKKLEEFYGMPKKINGLYGHEIVNISLSKAPQSWQYIEVE